LDGRIKKEGDIEEVVITLGRGKGHICSECGQEVKVNSRHSFYIQEVRHLHLWRYLTVLRFEKVKVRCPLCGIKVEKLDSLDKHSRFTKELSHQIEELCKAMTIEDVTTFEHLHWQTVKEIDKKAIEKAQTERDLDGMTVLGIDENILWVVGISIGIWQ